MTSHSPILHAVALIALSTACGESSSDSSSDTGGAEWFASVGAYCPWSATVSAVTRR